MTDVTGNGHTGTIQNSDGTEWVAGYIGTYALELSGSQCVTTLNSTASQLGIGGNDPRSIGAWANITTFNNGGLFDLGSTGSAGQEFCLRTTTNANQFRAQFWSTPDFDVSVSGAQNNWHHYMLVHDGTQGMIFADGELAGFKRSTINTNDGRNLEIGRYGGGTTLQGTVDDLVVYDSAIKPNQIAYLAGGGDPASLPDPQPGLLPILGVGPDGSHTANWGIREVRYNGTLNSVYDAVDSLLSGTGTIVDGFAPVVNHNDPQSAGGGGYFGNASKAPFLSNTGGGDDDIAFLARSKVVIPADGWYTFGFRGDDGGLLKLIGADFQSRWGGAIALDDTLAYVGTTGDSNSGGVTWLDEGEYLIEFLFFERGGGAYVELWAAQGDYSSFDAEAFALVGDWENGGLQLTPEPATLSLLGLGLLAVLRRRKRN